MLITVHILILTIAKIILTLGEGQTYCINGSFGSPEKKFNIKILILILKSNSKFCLSLHYNTHNSYLFVNGNEIFKFKVYNKSVDFSALFFFLKKYV